MLLAVCSSRLLALPLLIGFLATAAPVHSLRANPRQDIEVGPAEKQVREAVRELAVQEEEKKAEKAQEKEDDNTPMLETDASGVNQPGPREVRLELWDGSVLTGDLGIDSIHIDTKFGTLEVPVSNIQFLRPGLESIPEMKAKIAGLVEQLGDKEFQNREKAHRDLLAMGLTIRSQLRSFADGGSAERKKHLQTLTEEIEELAEDEDPTQAANAALELEDSITTGDFTIVGRIRETEFALKTRYGDLQVRLQDIRSGDRATGKSASAVRKSIDIEATAFFQRDPAKTRIRVKAGDRISIRATGTVNWASWGNMASSPEGIGNQGQWNGMNCGALAARIGKGDDVIKIGEKADFVAKSSGELILGIAMQDNFASQEGYQWTGKYTARIVVEPGPGK
jgi:hypothetical protein